MNLQKTLIRLFVPSLGTALFLLGPWLIPQSAHGQTLYSYVSTDGGWDDPYNESAETWDDTSVSVSGSDSMERGGSFAAAQTDFGYNYISHGAWTSEFGYLFSANTFANSEFQDLLTINTNNSLSGLIRLRYQVNINYSGIDSFNYTFAFESSVSDTIVANYWDIYDIPWMEWDEWFYVTELVTTLAPFSSGQAFSLTTKLRSSGGISGSESPSQDLFVESQLLGLEVLDAQGEPMADAWISSASGTSYANLFGAAAAPEPGTLALCGIALTAGGAGWLRRRAC